jgi:hypothetical protein
MLTKHNILWSKGIIRDVKQDNGYYLKQTERSSSMIDIRNLIDNAKNYIFIRNGSVRINSVLSKDGKVQQMITPYVRDLDYFAQLLDRLKTPVILITSDGDRPVPSSCHPVTISKILSSNKILKWYTQNYDKTIIHDKISHFPIGFDLHSNHLTINNNINDTIRFYLECRNSSPVNNRIKNRIYCDSHLSKTHSERGELYEILKSNKFIDFSKERIPFSENTKQYNKYNFVLSPRGNGLDCHRTWELFIAGAIVITKTSSLDDMYINNELPVVILNDWNELNDENLDEKLASYYKKYSDKTVLEHILPRLTTTYWLET